MSGRALSLRFLIESGMSARDAHQRKAYAMRRMSAAVDRVIVGRGDTDKARRWVRAWAWHAGVRSADLAVDPLDLGCCSQLATRCCG